MIIGIYPGTFISFAATILHRGFFCEHDARAADRVFSESNKVPIGRRLRLLDSYWHIGETTMRLRA